MTSNDDQFRQPPSWGSRIECQFTIKRRYCRPANAVVKEVNKMNDVHQCVISNDSAHDSLKSHGSAGSDERDQEQQFD